MLRSMYSGISGMKNFQTKLDVIGNNIANVNTYGFKKSRVTFSDTMNQTISGASASQENRGGTNSKQVGLGSTISTIDTIHTGSSLQTTGRSLDLGINGDGYFVVKQGDAQYYSRAGNFYLDDNGTLVTGEGLKVQSYEKGVLKDITVNVNSVLPATITDKLVLTGNLPKTATGTEGINQQLKVVDKDGKEHVLDVTVTPKNALTGDWAIKITNSSAPATPVAPATGNSKDFNIKVNDNGSVTFDTTTPNTLELNSIGIGGAISQKITLSTSEITKTGDSITLLGTPNGNTSGSLESFNIGQMGEINGVFSNGLVKELGKLAMAKFSNSSGLTKAGSNTFQESINSGTANINVAGNGRGTLAAGSLEMSNVDLSEEFTDMIVAQRGFQANSRIITTSDEILQELVNLKR